MYVAMPSTIGTQNSTTKVTPEAESSRAKISGTMIVESGTISCTRISAHCVSAITRKLTAPPM